MRRPVAPSSEDKARKEKRTAERAKRKAPDQKVYQLTLDNVNKPDLQLATNEKKSAAAAEEDPIVADDDDDKDGKNPKVDPVRNETLNVLADLIELSRAPKTASVNK